MNDDKYNEGVIGFLFTGDLKRVALVFKKKPKWQKDKWNGIGGKVKIGEEPSKAMVREFEEETNARVEGWEYDRTRVFENGYTLHFYYKLGYQRLSTVTDEVIQWHDINRLPKDMVEGAKEFIKYLMEVRLKLLL